MTVGISPSWVRRCYRYAARGEGEGPTARSLVPHDARPYENGQRLIKVDSSRNVSGGLHCFLQPRVRLAAALSRCGHRNPPRDYA
jgi:hypothetical protein